MCLQLDRKPVVGQLVMSSANLAKVGALTLTACKSCRTYLLLQLITVDTLSTEVNELNVPQFMESLIYGMLL